MAFRVKIYVLVLAFLILLSIGSSSGLGGPNPDLALHETDGEGRIRSRKLLTVDFITDYDDVCANPKHDPRRKPGCKNIP
ncbi:hypothetical protein MLD38_025722 [Melastoma candidum]|uniref:Uncharacterized protein n=1 Tax=Melastoma candidum TaxID=119954 RepID=A0ACB9NVZ7_9MYRT|nr:hypothetical protein MLD38_025722 [Melastoma candidum]